MASRVSALIVSGFLGSGKTSLVRHLLADGERGGLRTALVSNEFGELGIDAELLARPGEDYVEIAGGCVCCRLSDELVATLAALRERVDPDRVIVETSGVALPFETQMHLWRDPLRDWIEDDVAVVVVNAEQVAAERDLGDTFAQQVSSADLLVLNQVDRVGAARVPEIETRLRALEPEAPIVHTTHGAVEPDLLFPPEAAGERARRRETPPAVPPHEHERFDTLVLPVEAGVARQVLLDRVRALGALRAKGFVETDEGLALLQGVGPRLELSPVRTPPPPALVGRIVAIRRA